MPAKKTTAASAAPEHKHADLEKKVAALQKEVAALKKELAKAKSGADPRVDKILEYLQKRTQERPEGMTRPQYKEMLEKLIFS